MESVMDQIRKARQVKNTTTEHFLTEAVIDGCHVKMRFDSVGNKKIMETIRSMLLSAHMDAALASAGGGASE